MTSKRLARLVRLKRLIERSHLAALQEQRAALKHAESQLLATEQRLMEAPSTETSEVAELTQEAAFREHLSAQAQVQRLVVADRSKDVDDGETKMRGAWTERRLFEHIHGRAVRRELEDERREEWRANDAVALNAYARKQAKPE